MTIYCGIDEAGRGPVLGPMVMVALTVDEQGAQKLEWLGVKDSKLLSKEAREELFERIREVVVDFRIEIIEPDAIDAALNDGEMNLNWLEAETSARMASELNPDVVYVDCPSTNIPAYTEYFASRLSKGVRDTARLVVEHKADFNYIVVAAASVIAKVIRDRSIDHQSQELGVEMGSGYMSDPKTQAFLKEHYKSHAEVFRKSWKSYQRILETQKQSTLGDF